MRRLLIALVLLALLPAAASAAPIYLIGTVTPNTPSNDTRELLRLTYFINYYNLEPDPGLPSDGSNTYGNRREPSPGDGLAYPLPASGPMVYRFQEDELPPLLVGGQLTLPAPYNYVVVKYGGYADYYYTGGVAGPFEVPRVEGISHVSVFGTVPDAGSSAVLLGLGFLGLAAARRRIGR